MVKAKVYNLEGKEISEKNLSSDIFKVAENQKVLAQAIIRQLAAKRNVIAHTKTRGEVRGGGRKPWRQKGTGRARAGSTRSPLWIGGGITFGPRKTRNFQKRIPQKMKNQAIKMLLSGKIAQKKLIILKDFEMEKFSTKALEKILQKLPIEEGRILVVLPKMNANLELSMANLPYLKTIRTENINSADLIKYDYLITTLGGIEKITKILSFKKEKTK